MNVFRPALTRKMIVSAAVSMALSLSMGYSNSALADNRQVDLIPDDTIFYTGTGKPVLVEDMFALMPDMFNEAMLEGLAKEENDESVQKVLAKLSEFLEDPVKVTESWGLGKEIQYSMYAVGLMPVLRIAADAEQFETAMTKLEAETEFTFERMEHKGLDLRVYMLDEAPEPAAPKLDAPDASAIAAAEAELATVTAKSEADNAKLKEATAAYETAVSTNDASGIAAGANAVAQAANEITANQKAKSEAEAALAKLQQAKTSADKLIQTAGRSGPAVILAADGKDIIATFAHNVFDKELLDQLLGIQAPKKSLEASGKLKKIRKEWNYNDEIMMYFDFQLLADAITGGDTLGAQHLAIIAPEDLSLFSAEPCTSEVRQMAANVPMMVGGNRKFEVTDTAYNIDGHFALVIEHEKLRDTLQLVRGVVPMSQSSSEALLSFGVGIDVDNFPQLSGQITDLLGAVNYECEELAALNAFAATDISVLSMGAMMASGMARGIKGASMNLYDAEINPESPNMPIGNVDAAIAISAEDPAVLLQTLRMVPEMDMLAELPLDGTAMSLNDMLPIPLPPEVELFAAVKGKNIVIYSGKQASDFANRVSGNGKESVIVSSFNTAKMIEKFNEVADSLPPEMAAEQDLAEMQQLLKSYPTGSVYYEMDFTGKGIELNSVSEFTRSKK